MTALNTKQLVTGTVELVLGGAIATAPAINSLLGPMAHMSSRIVPIYALQPTAPVASGTFSVEQMSGSIYQTHGLWHTGTYDGTLTAMSMSNACGFIRDQFSTSLVIEYSHRIVSQRNNARWQYTAVDAGIEYSLTGSSEVQNEPAVSHQINNLSLGQISRDIFSVNQYQARYGDFGYCQFTTKDLCGASFYESQFSLEEQLSHAPSDKQFRTLEGNGDAQNQDDQGYMQLTITGSLPFDATSSDTPSLYYIDRFTSYAINSERNEDPT